MIVSHRHRFIYYAPFRCASTSLSRVLSDHYDAVAYPTKHDCFLPLEFENYYTFASVRNPYTRFVSAWNFLYDHGERFTDINAVISKVSTLFTAIFHYPIQERSEDCVPMRIDQILRVESLQSDFDQLPFVTYSPCLPSFNSQNWKVRPRRGELPLVREAYAIDFNQFGYDPLIVPPEVASAE